MATIINNPGSRGSDSDADSTISIIIGFILLLVVVGLFFVYALPALRNNTNNNANPQNSSLDVNLKLPAGGSDAPLAPATPAPAN